MAEHRNLIVALGLSEGINTFHTATREVDLETHNQLGPGITYVRTLNTGVHSGHQALCLKPAGEQESSKIPAEFVTSALSTVPQPSQNSMNTQSSARWLFCLDCCGWFRIIGGVNTSDNYLESFKLRPDIDLNNGYLGDAQKQIQAIHHAIACGSGDHRRSHHFHEVSNSIPQPPSADLDVEAAGLPAEKINETANLSSYHCCYCGLFLAYDATAPVSSLFSRDLLNRLMKRDPALGDRDSPAARYYRSLKLLHT